MVNCCAPIQIPGSGLRLNERSEEHHCGSDKFKLYECPSCGAFWVARDVFWDHGTWYRKEYIRVDTAGAFEALLESEREAKSAAKPASSTPRRPTVSDTVNDIARGFQIAIAIDHDDGNKKSGSGST